MITRDELRDKLEELERQGWRVLINDVDVPMDVEDFLAALEPEPGSETFTLQWVRPE